MFNALHVEVASKALRETRLKMNEIRRADHPAEIEAEKYRKALYDMMMDMTLAKFALAADSSTVEELPKFFDVSIKKAKEALGDE